MKKLSRKEILKRYQLAREKRGTKLRVIVGEKSPAVRERKVIEVCFVEKVVKQ